MKRILCYGDSNTWGYKPENGKRYKFEERWPGILQNELGQKYRIIEEGLNGRTTVWEDPIEGYKSGKQYLIPCLESHKPLDLVIVFLGTNDLKIRFSLTAYDIARGAGTLIEMIKKKEPASEVLLLVPPPLGRLTAFADAFRGGKEKSQNLAREYKKVAVEQGVYFLDTSEVVESSDIDGIHFEPESHQRLGERVATFIYHKI